MTVLATLIVFGVGVGIVVVATEQLLAGLVGVAAALRVAPFVAAVVLSGLEAENVADGLAAGGRGDSDVALGTAFGGAIFVLCIALGVGALIAPLRVHLPRGVVLLVPAAALLAGLPIAFDVTPRWTGVVLLGAFGLAMGVLIRAARGHTFVDEGTVQDVEAGKRSLGRSMLLTLVGIGVVAVGGELVAAGAEGLITSVGLSGSFVGMVVTPAAIEAEEIIRQVVPARRGYADVSAGNAVGTVLYFLLFNLGLIALLTPVGVPSHARLFDWPMLVLSACVAAFFLGRGTVGRREGAVLAAVGVVYAVVHLAMS